MTTLDSLPLGIDIGSMFAFEPSGGTTTVYVKRVACKGNCQDVYKFVDAG